MGAGQAAPVVAVVGELGRLAFVSGVGSWDAGRLPLRVVRVEEIVRVRRSEQGRHWMLGKCYYHSPPKCERK